MEKVILQLERIKQDIINLRDQLMSRYPELIANCPADTTNPRDQFYFYGGMIGGIDVAIKRLKGVIK